VYHNLGARDSLKTSIAHLTIYMRMLLGIYGKIPHCLALIKGAMADERNISKNSREVDGEIGLLVVDSTHRRMGIGRQLIDSFLGHAKKKGARKISVYTIDPGSDWRFYEHYGFRKYSSFRDNFMSLVQNEEVKGIIYVFDIGRRESSRFQE
ncbi:MAG: GNAT family N-acetyltransferase, partial [Thermoplasmata archaeon]|nr:GNAT family N-acetyltransferase [Thermoplasmata archaeon]